MRAEGALLLRREPEPAGRCERRRVGGTTGRSAPVSAPASHLGGVVEAARVQGGVHVGEQRAEARGVREQVRLGRAREAAAREAVEEVAAVWHKVERDLSCCVVSCLLLDLCLCLVDVFV